MKSVLPIFILFVFIFTAGFGSFMMGHHQDRICAADCLVQTQYILDQEIYIVKITNTSSKIEPQSFKSFSVFVPDRLVVPI